MRFQSRVVRSVHSLLRIQRLIFCMILLPIDSSIEPISSRRFLSVLFLECLSHHLFFLSWCIIGMILESCWTRPVSRFSRLICRRCYACDCNFPINHRAGTTTHIPVDCRLLSVADHCVASMVREKRDALTQ
jgi:hypothetical protein